MTDISAKLVQTLTAQLIAKTQSLIGQDAWELIPASGKEDVLLIGQMLVECALLTAAGLDVDNTVVALKAALGNWEIAGRIRVAAHSNAFLEELREALLTAGEVIFQMLGAGLRGLIL